MQQRVGLRAAIILPAGALVVAYWVWQASTPATSAPAPLTPAAPAAPTVAPGISGAQVAAPGNDAIRPPQAAPAAPVPTNTPASATGNPVFPRTDLPATPATSTVSTASTGAQTAGGLTISTTFAITGGEVMVDGQPAARGTEVRAICQADTVCGLARTGDAANLQAGQFRMTIFGTDGREETARYARDGDPVIFTVAGRPARVEPGYRWRPLSGEVIRLVAG